MLLSGRPLDKISWEKLSDEEKSNYELSLISVVIDDCSELIDKAIHVQIASAPFIERQIARYYANLIISAVVSSSRSLERSYPRSASSKNSVLSSSFFSELPKSPIS